MTSRILASYRGFEYLGGSRTEPARHWIEAEKLGAAIVAHFVARGWKSRIRLVRNQSLVGSVRIPPAQRAGQRRGNMVGLKQRVISGISVGLEDACPLP